VPTLLVSGSLDVRTPSADAAEIRRELSNGVLLQVEGVGHGEDFLAAPEVLESIRQFFLGKTVTPRPIALPRLQFRDDPLEKNRER
jgi:pimeloyl-ACP methyl ester carboxylesterase